MRLEDMKKDIPETPEFIHTMIQSEVKKQLQDTKVVNIQTRRVKKWTGARVAAAIAVCVLATSTIVYAGTKLYHMFLEKQGAYSIVTGIKADGSTGKINLPERIHDIDISAGYIPEGMEWIDEFHLETIYMPKDPTEILIDENDVTRPGLQLMGFYEYFNPERMQIIGKMEFAYLSTIDEETRTQRLDALMSRHIPALIIARELPYFSEMLDLAKKYEVPLLRSKESTSNFISGLIAFLNLNLAPRITRHGVLIEIYGEGVFITGESGVGKSETAIELVKRGHRLVADDAVEIRKVSNISLVGSSPDNIRHFLELRGIGIINARRLFGIGAVKNTEKIELIVEMEQWNPEKIYDRMGVDTQFATILGVKIPMLTIPVKPGRNLAVILEVAAMNNRQKKMGYNAATELLDQLGLDMESKEVVKDYDAF